MGARLPQRGSHRGSASARARRRAASRAADGRLRASREASPRRTTRGSGWGPTSAPPRSRTRWRRAGLGVRDVDALWCTSITGIAAPSLDARLINRLGFRSDLKRVPIFGLGCVAGRRRCRACGRLPARPPRPRWPCCSRSSCARSRCSATTSRSPTSSRRGSSATARQPWCSSVTARGGERAGHRGDPQRVLPGHRGGDGVAGRRERASRWCSSAEVPEMVRKHLRGDVDALPRRASPRLRRHRRVGGAPGRAEGAGGDGGDASRSKPGALDLAWESLRRVGNLSSASVLLVLQETLARAAPTPGKLRADDGDGTGLLLGAGAPAVVKRSG